MKRLIILLALATMTTAGCTTKVIYMPFLAPGADSAGQDLFQFYGYEDTLGRWHEWGYPKWLRTLDTGTQKPFVTPPEGTLPPVTFFGRPDKAH